jgi:anti-sigma factor RsiW
MDCDKRDVKLLLPAFLNKRLDPREQTRVQEHLSTCEDCRAELSLLRLLAEETVPDPGETYWAAMPDRVFRAVQAHKEKKWRIDLSWLADRLILPRWVLGAITVGIILMISLIAVRFPQTSASHPSPKGYDVSDEVIAAGGVPISSLDSNQLETVSAWAGNELASIAREAGHARGNVSDTDIYEEMNELSAKEAEQLSTMLDQWGQEGS